jgi:uncharacterized coiled-coil DUF342 family protein
MDRTLKNIKDLIDQVHTIHMKYTALINENMVDKTRTLQIYFEKVDKLVSTANQMKTRFISLTEDNDKLRDKAQNIDCMTDLLNLYVSYI